MAFLLLVLFSPILLFIALLIILFDRQCPLFIHKRIGKNGHCFRLYKFKTMKGSKSISSISVLDQKKVSFIGQILRKTKFDEIPELVNIIKGDMSLVGPRPDVSGYADKLTSEDLVILTVKPGITGPASLKYMNEEELLSQMPL